MSYERLAREALEYFEKGNFPPICFDLARAVLEQQAEIERLEGLLEMAEFAANSVHKNWNVE